MRFDFGFRCTGGTVASDIPEMDYTLDDIAAATQLALSGENREKTAAEHSSDVKAALGELMLMKVAGEIDRATFNREAAPLVKEAISLEGAGQALRGLGKRLYTMDSEEAARHLGGSGRARPGITCWEDSSWKEFVTRQQSVRPWLRSGRTSAR